MLATLVAALMSSPGLHVYMWAIAPTDQRDRVMDQSRYSLESARACGFEPKLLGLGHTIRNPERHWANVQARFYVLQDALRAHADDDLLLVMDGYDTLFLPHASPALMVDRFRHAGAVLMFSSEKAYTYQWPQYKAQFDQNTAAYRYLAAGTFIGRAWAIRDMAQACIHDMDHGLAGGNDMGLMGKYAADHPRRVALDYGRRIFWVTTNDQEHAGQLFDEAVRELGAMIVHVVAGRRELSHIYMRMYHKLRAATPTRPPASFPLAVRIAGGWIGPISLSSNGHFSVKLMIHGLTFYALPSALIKPHRPAFTTEWGTGLEL